MKFIKINIILLLLAGVTGCQKQLEEVPYSFLSNANIYDNEADVDKALIGAYSALNFDSNNDLFFFFMTSGPSEHLVTRLKTGAQGRMSAVNFISTDPQVAIWNDLYMGINRANAIIDNIGSAELDAATQNAKVAEARFIRAFDYFYLVRFFGGVPLQLSETTNFDDNSVKKPRNTLQEVYNSIIDDLSFAEKYLPPAVSKSNYGRATSYAAMGILGKVYLTMAGKPLLQTDMYAKAVAELQGVLGKYTLLPNYGDIFSITNEANGEIIFARPNITGLDGAGTVLTFYAGAPNSPYAYNGGQYQFGFTADFYNSFSPQDTRRDVTMLYTYTNNLGQSVTFNSPNNPPGLYAGGPTTAGGIPFGKLKDPGNKTSPYASGNDWIFLRYADVLLMLAESYNEMGNSSQALPYLNQVRRRAGIDLVTETNKDSLRNIIRQERKWELAGEFTEYPDLQRWGDLQASMAINPDAKQMHNVYDPKYELFPIPQNQLQANEFLKQNPGY